MHRQSTSPVVAEPQRRQQMQLGRLGSAVVRGDLNQDVVRAVLGIFHENIEVAIVIEDPGVEQFVFEFIAADRPRFVSTRSA